MRGLLGRRAPARPTVGPRARRAPARPTVGPKARRSPAAPGPGMALTMHASRAGALRRRAL
eukprot:2821916-Heterocapsa_arctica.AAC.1